MKKYKDDIGIYKHELEHVRQWFYTLGLHSLMYLLIPAYRLLSEVQAYREQARWYADDRRELFAGFIANHYRLKITQAQALEMLK